MKKKIAFCAVSLVQCSLYVAWLHTKLNSPLHKGGYEPVTSWDISFTLLYNRKPDTTIHVELMRHSLESFTNKSSKLEEGKKKNAGFVTKHTQHIIINSTST